MNKRTGKTRLQALLGVTVGVFALAGASFGQMSASLDLDLKDAGLVTAVQALTNRTGIQFVIADDEAKFRPITLSLRRATPEQAIEMMCKSAEAWAERNEAGVYIIRAGSPAPAAQANATVAPSAPKELRKIRLLRSDPKLVYDQLLDRAVYDPNGILREANDVRNLSSRNRFASGRSMAVTSSGVTPLSGTDLEKAGLKDDSSNDILLPGETANQIQPGGNFGGGQAGGGIGGGQAGGGIGGGQGGAGGGGIAISPGQGLVPDGIEYLSYDPTDNSIVVRGTDDAIRRLQQAIALFDIAPKQVEIKVEFITTSSSISRTFGIDWTFSRGAVFAGNNPGAFARTGDPIFVNYSTGNFVTRLRTQLIEGDGKVVAAPLVRTFNNQLGFIRQSSSTTLFVPTQTVTQGVINTVFNPVELEIGTELAVRPRINNDGYITMTLTPVVEQFGQIRSSPDGSQVVPDVIGSAINIATRVKDGETILIAGFNGKQSNTTVTRFPILSDLPIIGSLFRSSSTNRNDSELLIFVTPRIIVEDDDASFTP